MKFRIGVGGSRTVGGALGCATERSGYESIHEMGNTARVGFPQHAATKPLISLKQIH